MNRFSTLNPFTSTHADRIAGKLVRVVVYDCGITGTYQGIARRISNEITRIGDTDLFNECITSVMLLTNTKKKKYKDFNLNNIAVLLDNDQLNGPEILEFTKFARKYLAKHNIQITPFKHVRITPKSKLTLRCSKLIDALIKAPNAMGGIARVSISSYRYPWDGGMTDVQHSLIEERSVC